MNTAQKIVDFYNNSIISNNICSEKYYIKESTEKNIVISNVNKIIYSDNRLFEYEIPVKIDSRNANQLISILKLNLDYFNDNQTDGNVFLLNRCLENAKYLFLFLASLSSAPNFPITESATIVLGYISSKISRGAQLGNFTVINENIFAHHFHAWCMINKFIVDMSLFQKGNKIELGEEIKSWGKAQDHVFLYPPPDTSYYGVKFNSLESVGDYLKNIFDK